MGLPRPEPPSGPAAPDPKPLKACAWDVLFVVFASFVLVFLPHGIANLANTFFPFMGMLSSSNFCSLRTPKMNLTRIPPTFLKSKGHFG